MEENLSTSLLEMTDDLRQIESLRISCNLKNDRETKRFHSELVKKLDALDETMRKAMMGIS